MAELEATLSSRELAEWIAYAQWEPFGQPRADDGHRLVASLLFNINRSKGQRAMEPGEFLKPAREPDQPRAVVAEKLKRALGFGKKGA
ncbi:MAG: hypothetical protein INF91_05650 [Alphaproteobacteria bacterium]|nr:hypothetical protein [Alphaproteobacteria bacterium]